MKDDTFYNRVGGPRISARQVDELIGLARGVCADGVINIAEAEFLEKWLGANLGITDNPIVALLYNRVSEMLSDGNLSEAERADLFNTLADLTNQEFELGEALKATSLPLCNPAPKLEFVDRRYTFTGKFAFGQRWACEAAVCDLGAEAGSLTRATDYLVIGVYATDSWKHSSFGNKILKACEMREKGVPISIVSEEHWLRHIG
jgi:hypothetical protein